MPRSLTRGQRVGGRYRLERELGTGTDCSTWEALDERLDRPVALRIFAGSDRATIVKKAGIAASLTHPRVVRVFDTGEDAGRFFTVSELLPGSLRTVRLPLEPDEALHLANDIAEALHYAHERGVVHGNLHESNVLLSESGAKVGDFALSRAGERADKADDLRQFGALMRRASRLPDPGAPPGFARVVDGLGTGAYPSAADALNELRALRPKPVAPRRPGQRRGWIVIAIAVLLGVLALGVMQLGERSPKQRLLPGGRIEGKPLAVASIRDFDPFGTPVPRENPGQVKSAVDSNPGTFWTTESYSGSADFNGRKSGVGLIVDLGKPTEVGKAEVLFTAQGCAFDVRFSDAANAPVDEWGTKTTVDRSPQSAALEFEASTARYWLVWITRLVPEGSGFRCGIREIELFSP